MAKISAEQLEKTPKGREFIKRYNFNLLLADVIDNNLVEMNTLMKELGVFIQEPKRDMNKLRHLSQGMVTESDAILTDMAESFGEVADFLYKVMYFAEDAPKEYRETILTLLKDGKNYE